MRGKERFLVLLEIGFISLKHTIEPRQEFVSTVVRVQDDRNAVSLGDGADVKSGSNGTGDRSLLFIICKAFSGEIGATALGDLKNDRRFDISSSLEDRICSR